MARDNVYEDILKAKDHLKIEGPMQISWPLSFFEKDPFLLLDESFGTRILEDFRKIRGDITNYERDIALWYFSRDYRVSQKCAEKYLARFKKSHKRPEEGRDHLNNAEDRTNRALSSLESGRKLQDQQYIFLPTYEECLRVLTNFRDKIYFAREFAGNWEQIYHLHKMKAKAILEEKFERAARINERLHKQIESI